MGISKDTYKEFLAEAEEHIEALYSNIDIMDKALRANEKINPEVLNAMFRSAHSLKGLSGMFGFETMSKMSHELENILDEMRLGKRKPDINYALSLYDAVDVLRKLLGAEKEEKVTEELRQESIRVIEKIKSTPKTSPSEDLSFEKIVPERIRAVMTEYEEYRLKDNIEAGANLLLIKALFNIDDFDEKLGKLTDIIKEKGEVISTLPSGEDIPPGKIKFELLVGTEETVEEIERKLKDYDVEILPLKKKEVPSKVSEKPVVKKEKGEERPEKEEVIESPSLPPTHFLKVDIYQLDDVMNTVGELFLIRSSIERFLENWKRLSKPTEEILEMERIERALSRNLSILRESIMEMRMVPIRTLFDRIVRAVKKISRDTGKKISIDYAGEETKLDKFIIEELMDPIMHIVRNSIDHGIESPEERILAGKPEEGKIMMRAYQRGNHVVIEVEDDGRGIDIKKVRAKAIEKGLISKSESLTNEDLLQLIFLPGFSTKDEVTMISGRGVGLDVVADKIKSLRGIVEVKTKAGSFTNFIITLPVTLAIIQALIVRVGQREFGIPITSVLETIEYSSSSIKPLEKREVLLLRDETIPIVKIESVFGFPNSFQPNYIIISGVGEKKIAIPVTDLLGRSDVVIKSLGRSLKNIKGLAGVAEIGDNRIILIIEISSLMEEIMRV